MSSPRSERRNSPRSSPACATISAWSAVAPFCRKAREEADRYRAGASGEPLAAVLHRLGPTAELLGFSYLSAEALAVETQLYETRDRVDLARLADLLTQSGDRLGTWVGEGAPLAAPAADIPPR